MNQPQLFSLGRKANRKPETPYIACVVFNSLCCLNPIVTCMTAPMLKQVLAPMRAPNLPKMGLECTMKRPIMNLVAICNSSYLNRNKDKLAMPKTKPYCAGVAPIFSASEG